MDKQSDHNAHGKYPRNICYFRIKIRSDKPDGQSKQNGYLKEKWNQRYPVKNGYEFHMLSRLMTGKITFSGSAYMKKRFPEMHGD